MLKAYTIEHAINESTKPETIAKMHNRTILMIESTKTEIAKIQSAIDRFKLSANVSTEQIVELKAQGRILSNSVLRYESIKQRLFNILKDRNQTHYLYQV